MTQTHTGQVRANGLQFHYLSMGEGPLALLLHGFPDTAHTWRHLMPALAAAGYRVVAPYMRGYAPTDAPDMTGVDGMSLFIALGADANALHAALGGDERAVIVGHDWGAVATYSAALQAPDAWRKVVTLAVPPLQVLGPRHSDYAQLKRSFYMWFFQMAAATEVVRADDFAFIRHLWADWSPRYDAGEDVAGVVRSLAAPEHLDAAIGYYRAFFNAERFSFAYGDAAGPVSQPLLYLHGADDGCIALGDDAFKAARRCGGEGSDVAVLPGCGHFLQLEQPEVVGRHILGFLARP